MPINTSENANSTQEMTKEFIRHFPELSPAQRLHIEVYGYTVVPGVHSLSTLPSKAHWACGECYRDLSQPVAPTNFTLADGWHVAPDA